MKIKNFERGSISAPLQYLFNGRKSLDKNKPENPETEEQVVIFGRHPVMEAFNNEVPLDKVYLKKGVHSGFFSRIRKEASEAGVPVTEADDATLSRKSGGGNHQGVVAVRSLREYNTIDDIFDTAAERYEDPFILVLNEVQDPHNLGSLIRSAAGSGVHGVIIPRRRSARLTSTVSKVSAGTDVYVNVVIVTNVADTLYELKERGVLVIGADAGAGELYFDLSCTGPVAIVMGGEHKGLGVRVREACDKLVKIPLCPPVESLNVGVAGGILMFRLLENRLKNIH
jgi:23S rRNA (guanosine2251-2'-O)-methyltransferase